jgi:hypothetical protein
MRGFTATLLTLGALALLCVTPSARANPDEAPEPHRPRRTRSAEILLDMNDATRNDREPGGRFRIRKRYGLEYSHRFNSEQGPPVIFSIQGPAMPRKRLGLSFEVRF